MREETPRDARIEAKIASELFTDRNEKSCSVHYRQKGGLLSCEKPISVERVYFLAGAVAVREVVDAAGAGETSGT